MKLLLNLHFIYFFTENIVLLTALTNSRVQSGPEDTGPGEGWTLEIPMSEQDRIALGATGQRQHRITGHMGIRSAF